MQAVTRQIIVFVLITLGLSAIPETILLAGRGMATGEGFAVYAVMWCPALAALITCRIFKIDMASLGWNWRPVKYEWLGWGLPILYALPVYGFAWLYFDGAFTYDAFAKAQAASWGFVNSPNLSTWLLAVPAAATIGVIRSMASALGEEIGWRGFLLPRLSTRFGFTLGCFISGIIWALWHYPAIIGAGYSAGTSTAYELACFTAMVVAMAFVLGWVRLKSQSLWPCAILHASHNLFIQHIFDGMTATKGPQLYITTEFGIGMVITIGLAGFWFWRKRGALPA